MYIFGVSMASLDESLIDWQWLADVGLNTELPIPDYTCNLNTCDSHRPQKVA